MWGENSPEKQGGQTDRIEKLLNSDHEESLTHYEALRGRRVPRDKM